MAKTEPKPDRTQEKLLRMAVVLASLARKFPTVADKLKAAQREILTAAAEV